MDKKTRFKNAIHGKPVDRVPVGFYKHIYNDDDNAVEKNVQWVKATNIDMLAIEPDGYYTLHWDSPLQTLDDWKKLRPYKKTDSFIAGQIDRAKRVAEKLKDDAAVYYCIFTPFSYIKRTIGVEQPGEGAAVMKLWREDRDTFKQVMDIVEQDNWLLIDEMKKETGIDGFLIAVQSGERWRFSVDEYREYQTPYDKRMIAYANSKYEDNILHLHTFANEPNNIGVWSDYDYQAISWRAYNTREQITLPRGRVYFRPGSTLVGGFDNGPEGILYKGNEKEIKDYTKKLIQETGDVGLILSADCSVIEDTPDEHLRWVVEAAEEYAQGIL